MIAFLGVGRVQGASGSFAPVFGQPPGHRLFAPLRSVAGRRLNILWTILRDGATCLIGGGGSALGRGGVHRTAKPLPAARLLEKAAHDIQKVLGRHQDSVVARDVLRRLAAEAFLQGENGFTYGRLHALEQCQAGESEEEFHHDWATFPAELLK